MDKITKKEKEVLSFIRSFLEDKQYPPTVREICMAVGLKSSSTGHYYLNKLEKKGFIRRDTERSRAIELLPLHEGSPVGKNILKVPLVGQVAAGIPLLAAENLDGYYPLPAEFFPDGDEDLFLLRVKGDSMSGVGIFDKDLIIVRQQEHAGNGDIVVALINNDDATVKRIYYRQGAIVLQPENSKYEPIICNEVKIIGKVTGLFRKM